jgi:hypothetical protein
LTSLAGLNGTAGLVEQTGADAFTKRLIGVANTTDVPTRSDGDARWQALDSDLTTIAAGNNGTVLAAITASFLTADESKLDGIAAGATVGATWGSDVASQPAVVEQAEAEAGTATTERIWTAQRIAQAIAALGIEGPPGEPGAAAMPRGHLWGLWMSNAADADHDITVAVGDARDEAGTEDITLGGAITKQIDAGWAVGTGAGGLNTGTVANTTWYEVHLIKRTDTGVVDVMFTTTANRATLPANYDVSRRIGWVRSNGSANILAFTQVDDYFTLTTDVENASAVAMTTTAADITLTAPPNSIARFRASIEGDTAVSANTVVVFYEKAQGTVTPSGDTAVASLGVSDAIGEASGHFALRVSATSTIAFDCSIADVSIDFNVSTFGWIDHRGKMSN